MAKKRRYRETNAAEARTIEALKGIIGRQKLVSSTWLREAAGLKSRAQVGYLAPRLQAAGWLGAGVERKGYLLPEVAPGHVPMGPREAAPPKLVTEGRAPYIWRRLNRDGSTSFLARYGTRCKTFRAESDAEAFVAELNGGPPADFPPSKAELREEKWAQLKAELARRIEAGESAVQAEELARILGCSTGNIRVTYRDRLISGGWILGSKRRNGWLLPLQVPGSGPRGEAEIGVSTESPEPAPTPDTRLIPIATPERTFPTPRLIARYGRLIKAQGRALAEATAMIADYQRSTAKLEARIAKLEADQVEYIEAMTSPQGAVALPPPPPEIPAVALPVSRPRALRWDELPQVRVLDRAELDGALELLQEAKRLDPSLPDPASLMLVFIERAWAAIKGDNLLCSKVIHLMATAIRHPMSGQRLTSNGFKHHDNLWRMRVGPARVVYQIHGDPSRKLTVEFKEIAKRGEAYNRVAK